MSERFETTELWVRTLAARDDDPFAAQREMLRSAFLQFRRAVEPLAGEIAISMPMFTDHSIAHVDALWDTASLLIDDNFPLNPAEAFVLGGAFLLHDLGMGLAAFPEGQDSIRRDPLFGDIKAAMREATEAVSEEDADAAALTHVLRLRHAAQAERLVTQEFQVNGQRFFLLQDAELRSVYGSTIGRIAHSHWFDASVLFDKFPVVMGSFGALPAEWQVDPFKVACLLRLADAAQIDSRRAPMYLHAFRKPTGVSSAHWSFQQRLMKPRRVNDRLEYSATQGFAPTESEAWWLAYDTIKMISNELRNVDAVCADLGKHRFPVRSVAGADDPVRFAKYVATDGWNPIDARLKVSNVSHVVEQLGGAALYGERPLIAVREIISNAADATRARRVQYGGPLLTVEVSLEREGDRWVLAVRDRGLGMTTDQLVANLTDFGKSNWVSTSRIEEYPGLVAKGYRATGRFGIGFYAAFMVADKVEVRSLKYRGASADTSVLVFNDGVRERPLLRAATEDEQLDLGGTEVRMFLKEDPYSDGGVLGYENILDEDEGRYLERVLRDLCALLDIDLAAKAPSDASFRTVIRGDEWKTLSPDDLFTLLYPKELHFEHSMYGEEFRRNFVENIEDILDEDGDVVARAAIAVKKRDHINERYSYFTTAQGQIYVGGMAASEIFDVLGAFVGRPLKADRNSATPVASIESAKQWAESQGKRVLSDVSTSASARFAANEIVQSFGGRVAGLTCGFTSEGPITGTELEAWAAKLSEIYLVDTEEVLIFDGPDGRTSYVDRLTGKLLSLPESVILQKTYTGWRLPGRTQDRPRDARFTEAPEDESATWGGAADWWHVMGPHGTPAAILEAASKAWSCDPVLLGIRMENCRWGWGPSDNRLTIPCEGAEVRLEGFRLIRPIT